MVYNYLKGGKMKELSIKVIILLLLINFGFSSRQVRPERPKMEPCRQKPWTILVFINGDNNLEPDAIDDINEMERAIDTSLYYVVVEIDRIPGYDNSNGDWVTTRDYYITYDPSGDRIIRSELLWDLGELNMGDPNTLIEFVTYYKDNYPADNYLVILWDHGDGWYDGHFVGDPLFKGIGHDETDDDWLYVASGEYFYALDSISSYFQGPIDILAHDACLMAMYEVGYEAKDFADVIVFSEYTEPGKGYPYTDILNWLNANSSATSYQLATAIVNEFVQSYRPGGSQYCGQSATQSAVVTDTFFQELSQWIDIFAQELIGAGGLYQSDIALARYLSQAYPSDSVYSHIDLYHFAELINATSSLPASLRACADSLMQHITYAVLAEDHYSDPGDSNVDNSHGVAIYYPFDTLYINYDYPLLHSVNDYPYWWIFLQGATGVQEKLISTAPSHSSLLLSPNPTSDKVTIQYNLSKTSMVSIKIYNAIGRLIKTIINSNQKEGIHNLYWDGRIDRGLEAPGGIYFCRIESDNFSSTAKFTLVR